MGRKVICVLLSLTLVAALSGCLGANRISSAQTFPSLETTKPEQPPQTEHPQTEPLQTEPPQTEPEPEEFILTFAGDCTFGSQMQTYYAGWGFVKTVGEDYSYPFRNVLEYFQNDDFTMVNLEGPLCNGGNPVQKAHTFRGSTEYVRILTGSSVESVTLANNHCLDYGVKGYASTKETLENAGVAFVEKKDSMLFTTERGLTIGVYAEEYTDLNMERLTAQVASLREQGAEIVVYAVHWGGEYTYRPVSNQVERAHQAIDAGVDIVFGTHPHVLQQVEHYNGKVIFYSLGNFSFGGNIYPGDMDTALMRQQVLRMPDGTVELGELTVIPACLSSIPERNNFQPTPYEPGSEGYERVMEKLAGNWRG